MTGEWFMQTGETIFISLTTTDNEKLWLSSRITSLIEKFDKGKFVCTDITVNGKFFQVKETFADIFIRLGMEKKP